MVLLFVGLDEASESEGMDRVHMKMPQNQLELINAVAQMNKELVVVVSAGSVVEMPWIKKQKQYCMVILAVRQELLPC